MTASLTQEQLRALARHGAQARLTELRDEMAAIEQAFPDVRARRGGRPRKQSSATPQPAATAADAPEASGRRGWTAAQRKAAGERMKAYWAKRKAAKRK